MTRLSTAYTVDNLIYEDPEQTVLLGVAPVEFDHDIVIPNTVKQIKRPGFSKLKFNPAKCKSITIPGSVERISSGAFKTSVETIQFENGIKKINEGAFMDCDSENIILPESVKEIDQGAFAYSKVKNINLENVEVIGYRTFMASNIENAVLKNVKELCSEAFSGCLNLKSLHVIPNTLITIPRQFCYECESLEDLKLENIDRISQNAFANTSILRTVNLPLTLKTIEEDAFQMSGLRFITIPSSVEVIYDEAFACCYGMEEVIIEESEEKKLALGSNLFFDNEKIKSLIIPSSVKAFDDECLQDMHGLETLTINTSVDTLPERFAKDCKKLKNIYLSPEIKFLEEECFANTAFEIISDNFKNIKMYGKGCFSFCDNLRKAYIKDAFLDLGTFGDCKSLHLVTVLSDKDIPVSAFANSGPLKLFVPNVDGICRAVLATNKDITILDKIDEEIIEDLSCMLSFRELSKLPSETR